jgi:hypothetical protein
MAAFPGLQTPDEFWDAVRINLAADKLRLVFVADVIPAPLRRIVEYLNRQMTETEVLAIEVKQYVDDGGTQQMIVPRVIGQTEAARAAKGRATTPLWDRVSILGRLAEHGGAAEADVARRLFEWADGRGDLLEGFGRGVRDGSWQAGYWESSRYFWPFVLYTYGRVEIQFQHIAKRPPFDDSALRAEFCRLLNAIDGVEISGEMLSRRPSIDLIVIASKEAFERFTGVLDWAYEQANARAASAR